MSVKVTCIYRVGMCGNECWDAPKYCNDWREFEFGEPHCKFIVPEKIMHDGEEVTLCGSCKFLYFEDYMIHRIVTAFERGEDVRIGKKRISEDIIRYLSVDYGDGVVILKDERGKNNETN